MDEEKTEPREGECSANRSEEHHDWLDVLTLTKRAGLPPEETLRRLRAAIRAKDRGEDHVCFYTADVVARQLWKTEWGHPTLAHFAIFRLGVCPRTARSWAQVGRELQSLPAIQAAFEAGKLRYSAVRALIRVATPETEEVWLARALQLNHCKRLEAEVARKKKGALPTDPDKRRIHEVKHRLVLSMDDTDYTLFQRVRAYCQERAGLLLTDLELVRLLSSDALCHELQEDRPGWKRVAAEHYRIVATPAQGGDPDLLVTEDEDGDEVMIRRSRLAAQLRPGLALSAQERDLRARREAAPPQREEGARDLPPRELVREVTIAQAEGQDEEAVGRAETSPVIELIYGDTSTIDPRNNGAYAPEAERDAPTSSALRSQVLARDGGRCLVCGSRVSLAGHHLHWRRYGGRTVLLNLASLCESCHSLVHARKLVILGDMQRGLTILDAQGQPFGALPDEPFTCGGPSDDGERGPGAAATDGAEERSGGCCATAVADGPGGPDFGPPRGPLAGAAVTPPRARSQPLLELANLPGEVDLSWLRANLNQLTWNERQGVLELDPERFERGGSGEERLAANEAGQLGATHLTSVPSVRLDDLVGQVAQRDQLRVAIAAAKASGEPLRHLLLCGGAGLGKTLLAQAVAGELGSSLIRVPAQLVRSPEVVLRALTSLTANAVLFMDELQALGPRLAELLYEALEGRLGAGGPVRPGQRHDSVGSHRASGSAASGSEASGSAASGSAASGSAASGSAASGSAASGSAASGSAASGSAASGSAVSGSAASGSAASGSAVSGSEASGSSITLLVRDGLTQRALRVRLPAFTFVGATTDEHLVPSALRSRLEEIRLRPYDEPDLAELLARAAVGAGLQLTSDAAARLAGAARGTPRTALRLLAGVRDEALAEGATLADGGVVERSLARRGIDARGLDPLDRAYLEIFSRGGRASGPAQPVALSTLAAELSTSEAVLREIVEPHLKRLGLIRITPRGRLRAEGPPGGQVGDARRAG